MATEISCINKTDRQSPHEKIKSVGGKRWDGTRWKISQEEAIKRIDSKEEEFYVTKNDSRVKVIVAKHNDNKYIKTEKDDELSNNLLSLDECPKD